MLIENRYLFPLKEIPSSLLCFYGGNSSGYYMDLDGSIFSDRRGKGLVQLNGSRTLSGHYFSLGYQKFRHDEIFNAAKKSPSWSSHFAAVPTVSNPRNVRADAKRSYAPNLPSAIKQKSVMIVSVTPDGYKLIVGSNPKFHTTEESWRSEMKRLASVKPGTKFIALEIKASVVSGGEVWE